ncbi:MAG: hypothetical protein FWC95_00880 [Defluviitaleaceae bacterium]|nr:hypothetical protein [Defluviitaleaceae bacterium]
MNKLKSIVAVLLSVVFALSVFGGFEKTIHAGTHDMAFNQNRGSRDLRFVVDGSEQPFMDWHLSSLDWLVQSYTNFLNIILGIPTSEIRIGNAIPVLHGPMPSAIIPILNERNEVVLTQWLFYREEYNCHAGGFSSVEFAEEFNALDRNRIYALVSDDFFNVWAISDLGDKILVNSSQGWRSSTEENLRNFTSSARLMIDFSQYIYLFPDESVYRFSVTPSEYEIRDGATIIGQPIDVQLESRDGLSREMITTNSFMRLHEFNHVTQVPASDLCWAATTAMIVNRWRGTNHTARSIEHFVFGWNCPFGGRTWYPVYFTDVGGFLQNLFSINANAFSFASFNQIISQINMRQAMYQSMQHITDWRLGHALLLIGYDILDGHPNIFGHVLVWDPATSVANVRLANAVRTGGRTLILGTYQSGGVLENIRPFIWRYEEHEEYEAE